MLASATDYLMAEWAERGGVDVVAGAVGLAIEAVPPEVGTAVDDAVDIFTFSIGAFDSFKPKFAKRYGSIGEVATNAYADEVRGGAFPDDEHCYRMSPEEAEKLAAALENGGERS